MRLATEKVTFDLLVKMPADSLGPSPKYTSTHLGAKLGVEMPTVEVRFCDIHATRVHFERILTMDWPEVISELFVGPEAHKILGFRVDYSSVRPVLS
jgi:hypothetical protein